MAVRLREPLLGGVGVVSGVAGVVAARCGGGCASCLACAVPLFGLVAAAVLTGGRRRRTAAHPSLSRRGGEGRGEGGDGGAPCSSP